METRYEIINITKNIILKAVSEQEKEEIMFSHNYLNNIIKGIMVYRFFRKNIEAIINISKRNIETVKVINDLSEDVNSYAWNMINAFYCYIEYYEKQFKDDFCKIKTAVYDDYVEYRFMYFARSFVVHKGEFLIGEQKFHFDAIGVRMEWYINNKVITSYLNKKKFMLDRQYFVNAINIVEFAKKVLKIIDKMQYEIIQELSSNMLHHFSYLVDTMLDHNEGDTVILMNESKKIITVINANIVLFIKKFIKFYYNLELILTENDKNGLNMLVKMLLKIYFQKDEITDDVLNDVIETLLSENAIYRVKNHDQL